RRVRLNQSPQVTQGRAATGSILFPYLLQSSPRKSSKFPSAEGWRRLTDPSPATSLPCSSLSMGSAAATFLLPVQLKQHSPCVDLKRSPLLAFRKPRRRRQSTAPNHPGKLPRTYTLTHSDITAKITLAISHTVNRAQGWYNRLQRDEVVAEWKKVQGKMSLHVHCHISGGHFLLDLIANLRYYIFNKELPVVRTRACNSSDSRLHLFAFVHGDETLFNNHPELEEAMVWVYFHSNLPEFNQVECWGPLRDAASTGPRKAGEATSSSWLCRPLRCKADCDCCFPARSLIPWQHDFQEVCRESAGQPQQ
ncbi:hypothetical protein BHM03_00052789, partial [Ensete ventricosum]